MDLLRRILKISLIAYIIYSFIFSFFIYNFHQPTSKKAITSELSNPHPDGDNPRVALIDSSEEAISARVSLIENAESHIDLAYYSWADGKVSNLMLGSILDAADRGVKVRILLDGIVQLANRGGIVEGVFLGFSSHPNIDIKLYEPFNPLLPLSWNNRMHDKMILVDNKLALIGGRNIVDRFYLNDVYGDPIVKDTEVLIFQDKVTTQSGHFTSVIDEMEMYYDILWEHKYSKPKHRYMSKRRIKKGEIFIENLRLQHDDFKETYLDTYFKGVNSIDWTEVTLPTNGIHFVANTIGRTNQDPKVLKAILQLSAEAKENIFIQSPYIIPSRSIGSLFEQYNIDTEKVTLITNSKASSPNVLAFSAFESYKKNMIDYGVSIYEYQGPGSIHGKTALFDKQISVVGTFNIDPRSSYINTESIVIIDSKPFYDVLGKEVQDDLAFSLKVEDDYSYGDHEDFPPYQSSKLKEIMISILSKLTPFIEHLL